MSVPLLRLPSVPLPPPRAESPPLRLALRPAASGGGLRVGALDGAWWPHSDDLLSEMPSLVTVLDRKWGRITRVTVNPTHWRPLPCEIPAQGHVVKAGCLIAAEDSRRDIEAPPGEAGAEAAWGSAGGAPLSVRLIMPMGRAHVSGGR